MNEQEKMIERIYQRGSRIRRADKKQESTKKEEESRFWMGHLYLDPPLMSYCGPALGSSSSCVSQFLLFATVSTAAILKYQEIQMTV